MQNRNLLVTNYDQTAFTMMGTQRNMLSYPLIKFTYEPNPVSASESSSEESTSELDCTNYNRAGNYSSDSEGYIDISLNSADDEASMSDDEVAKKQFDGFYAFTSRSVNLLPILKYNLGNKLEKLHLENAALSYTKECLDDNFPTYKITENFAAATGLRCFGVSTPEDMWAESLGLGYKNLIKPWEQQGMASNTKPEKSIPLAVINNLYSHQRQYRLTQIAQDAAKNYPQDMITLTFVNDNRKQCDEALTVPNHKKFWRKWPDNVSLKVYQHHATGNHATVDYLGSSEKVRRRTHIQQHGLFSTSSHRMMTRHKERVLQEMRRMTNR